MGRKSKWPDRCRHRVKLLISDQFTTKDMTSMKIACNETMEYNHIKLATVHTGFILLHRYTVPCMLCILHTGLDTCGN